MRVHWPPDVRADVEIWGPFTINHLAVAAVVFVPSALLAILAPLPLVLKVLFLVGGFGLGVFLAVIDAPKLLRLGSGYATRPRFALGQAMEDLLSALSVGEDGTVRGPGWLARWWVLDDVRPWQFQTEPEKASAMSAYAALAEDALKAGAELIWCVDYVPDLPRRELQRQRTLAGTAPPGLARLILARAREHARAGEESRALKGEGYVGIVAEDEKALEAASEAVSLRLGPIALRLSPEAARDWSWRQLMPKDWLRAEPPVRVGWLMPDAAPSLALHLTKDSDEGSGRRLEFE